MEHDTGRRHSPAADAAFLPKGAFAERRGSGRGTIVENPRLPPNGRKSAADQALPLEASARRDAAGKVAGNGCAVTVRGLCVEPLPGLVAEMVTVKLSPL